MIQTIKENNYTMRTTQQISERLAQKKKEIKRITEAIENEEISETLPYCYKSGEQHPEWSYGEALTSLVSEKLCLEWVLSIR